jgi:DNA polymerase-3 subunit delta
LILNADILDKKSKLRSFFEKDKDYVSIAFYPDNNETLIKFTQNFFSKIRVPISFENINSIVSKCSGDRSYLKNELKKIALFAKNKKKIETIDLIKLTNLTENFSINELIDMCLSKNQKKTIHILNENNFASEDCILIIRTFLYKSKRLLNLLNDYKINKDVNKTILAAKPAVFWKDKDIIKLQIKSWTPEKIKELIYNLNKLEIQIKRTSSNQLCMVSDFILEKSLLKTNN